MTPTRTIPRHLMPFVARQDPSLYSAVDHASWRFIMKLSKAFFAKHAHKVYLDGLAATGIHTERIPLISEMDEKLQKFGWRAVPIVGFIPSSPFMEFLSLGILPIACDMRNVENIHYTPAPDIVHEAAGHAPILADPAFAKYLRSYGEIARKVILTHKDEALYEAIRKLSDLKENPKTTPAQIEQAQKAYENALAALDEVSENIMLSRMGWWTFEYGLVGSLEDPKIYGAGLLSSVGESYNCYGAGVKKVPFSVGVIDVNFDITKPQPQLFVAKDFDALTAALEQLANRMAFRIGGVESLVKAKNAKTVTTTVLDSGIQIGGIVDAILANGAYVRWKGPVQLGFEDKELTGQGPEHHREGFGTPIGLLKDGRNPADLSEADLKALKTLEFASGVLVEGRLKSCVTKNGKTLIATYEDCTVRLGSETLFKPEWGVFDMACGARIWSVFGGAPDRGMYLEKTTGFPTYKNTQSSNQAPKELAELYQKVRELRESGASGPKLLAGLEKVYSSLEKSFPRDWLLRYEILELCRGERLTPSWAGVIQASLDEISRESKDKSDLIRRGLELLQ